MRETFRRIAIGLGAALALVILVAGLVFLRHHPWPVEPERLALRGDVDLVGVLLTPEGAAPHPAILMLSGAECATHDRLINRLFANHFVRRGFAVLLYDKRGCGESGGDHGAAELPDLAADARSAMRFLRGRPEIRGDAIGLMGTSQSGWFTPEVAVREGAAFVIIRSSPTERWDRTVLFELENDSRADGVDEPGIREIVELQGRVWEYYGRAASDPEYAQGPARAALEAEIGRARERDWYEQAPFELAPYDPETYASWAGTLFYDPLPWLERLEIPLLAIYGETDVNVPAERSAAVLRELAADPRRDFTVVVLPGVGHQLQSPRAWHRIGFVHLDEMAEFARAAVGDG